MALDFLLQLRNGMSAPAAAAAASLRVLRQAFRDVHQTAQQVAPGLSSLLQGAASGIASQVNAAANATKVLKYGLLGVAAAAGTAGFALGKTLFEAAKFKEGSLLRLSAQLGDKAGGEEFTAAIKIAEKTQFDPKQAVDALAKLATVFDKTDIRRAFFGAAADVVSASGGGNDEFGRLTDQIVQSVNAGKAKMDDIKPMLNAGLKLPALYDAIAENFGVKGKDKDEVKKKVADLLSKGKIEGERWTKSLFDALMASRGAANKGKLAGQVSEDMGSATIAGLVSNIKGGFDTLLGMAPTANWPAIVSLKALLKDVADLFSTSSPKGEALTNALRELSSAGAPVFEAMRRDLQAFTGVLATSKDGTSTFAGGLSVIALSLYEVISGIAWFGVGVVQFFGWLAKGGEAVGDFLFSIGAIGDYFHDLDESLYAIGRNLIDSVIRGLSDAWSEAKKVPENIAKGLADAWRGALGIHSPSTVFAEMGAQSIAGYLQGLGDVDVQGATSAATSAAVSGIAPPAGGAGGRGDVEVNVTLQLSSGGTDPKAVAQELLPQVGAAARDAVEQAFRRWEQQGA